MKSLTHTAVIAVALAALAAPVASFAQSSAPVTRAEVRSQLEQLQAAGYRPEMDKTQYPANLQAAQLRVDRETNAASGYGGVANGTSQSGAGFQPSSDVGLNSIYLRH